METAKGDLWIRLFPEMAPNTVSHFVRLANEGFYDGLVFHRVIRDPNPFVIQTGSPSGDGTDGPGFAVPDEISSLRHQRGSVGLARGMQPNTGGSQFYVCLAPEPHLDGKMTLFGQVVRGMDVADSIAFGDEVRSVTIVRTGR